MDAQGYSFDKAAKLFMEHLERQCYSSETVSGYAKDLKCFKLFMLGDMWEKDLPLSIIGKEELLKFMDDGRVRGNKTSTIGRRLSTMKSFYKFLVYELDYPIDVAARIRIPKAYTPLKNILTEDEVMRLLGSAKELQTKYHLLFSILYYTGSRLSPVRMLERNHVRLEERIIYFPKVKGGKDLYLPLHRNTFNNPKCPTTHHCQHSRTCRSTFNNEVSTPSS